MNFLYIILNFAGVNPIGVRYLTSIASLVMWIKLLFYLRLFAPFAALIRMIVEIIQDIGVFLVLFFIAVIGFGNAFYILSKNLRDPHNDNEVSNEIGELI